MIYTYRQAQWQWYNDLLLISYYIPLMTSTNLINEVFLTLPK